MAGREGGGQQQESSSTVGGLLPDWTPGERALRRCSPNSSVVPARYERVTRTGAVLSVLDCNTSDLEVGRGAVPVRPGSTTLWRIDNGVLLERLARSTPGPGRRFESR